MLIYQSSEFRKNAAKFGLSKRIENLLNRYGQLKDPTVHFDHYTARYYSKRIDNSRIVAEKRTVSGEEVLVLLDLVLRKDDAYEKLADNPAGYGRDRFSGLVDDEEIRQWVATQNAEQVQPQRESVPDDLLTWLDPPGWDGDSNETAIYESAEWVQETNSKEWRTHRILLHRVLEAHVDDGELGFHVWSAADDAVILACRLVVKDTGGRQALLLAKPFRNPPRQDQIDTVRSDCLRRLNIKGAMWEVPHDAVARLSSRSYPAYMVADRELWLQITSDEVDTPRANLSLSGEEMGLLLDLSNRANKGTSLPVFVDGRAGSGKSTMLLYLFADYCHRLRRDDRHLPVFLTYNRALVDVARNSVLKILRQHHRFVHHELDDAFQRTVTQCFLPFQDFLFSLLTDEERERFRPEDRIGFGTFKREFRKLRTPEARRVTPEMCWHVIRTFIKGYDSCSLLEPSDYRKLARNDRSVSTETFEHIYKHIWTSWYRELTEPDSSRWDDQDLIRHILNTREHIPQRTAVFCDEAQDFTRLELDFVMRLSLFANYSLTYGVNCLPFAFAGDPFQTLNPTGFRWKALGAAFHDMVIRPLDPEEILDLKVTRKELQFNYRSTQPIVGLTNIVQLWRCALFDHSDASPQESWFDRTEHVPLKFILDRDVTAEDLRDILAETVIVVPCDEDEEEAYIAADPVLSRILGQATHPKNVFSALACKGLEFGRVILYKFGEACDARMWDLLSREPQRDESTLQYEYFLNKLYVGSTRATRELYVIDTDEGDKRLWSHASSRSAIVEVCSLLDSRDRAKWDINREALFHPLSPGTREDSLRMREDNPLGVAEELESQGKALERSDLLRRAARYFSSLHLDTRSAICEAWALYYDGDYQLAGRRFRDTNCLVDAWTSFWNGGHWADLLDLYPHVRHPNMEFQARVAAFRLSDRSDLNALQDFSHLLNSIGNHGPLVIQRQWQDAVREFAVRIVQIEPHALDADNWSEYATLLRRLAQEAYQGIWPAAAAAAFRAGAYSAAVDCWELARATDSREYFLAKAQTAQNLNERIAWLARADQDTLIVQTWERQRAGSVHLSRDTLRIIGGALERIDRPRDAVKVWLLAAQPQRAKECLARLVEVGDLKRARTALADLIKYYLNRRQTTEAIGIFTEHVSALAEHRDAKRRFQAAILSALYTDDFDRSVVGTDYQVYDDFMRDLLRDRGWSSWTSPVVVGSALERIGSHVPTLRFYEELAAHSHDPQTIRFARERWLVVRRRQADESRDPAVKERLRLEAEARRHDWGISATSEMPTYPEIPRDTDYGIDGLPPTAVMNVDGDDVVLRIDRYEIAIGRKRKLIKISDLETWQTFLINCRSGTVDGMVNTRLDGDTIRFTANASGISGCFTPSGSNPYLELQLGKKANVIRVNLKQAFTLD